VSDAMVRGRLALTTMPPTASRPEASTSFRCNRGSVVDRRPCEASLTSRTELPIRANPEHLTHRLDGLNT
jgi:hypothetical protein